MNASHSGQFTAGISNEVVRSVWSDSLGHDRFDDDSFFFSVGGTSLAAVRVMKYLSKVAGVRLPTRLLFEHQTVGSLSNAVAMVISEAGTAE